MKAAVLVVAAGRGRRFGGPRPKQYLPLRGRPILRHSLATFAAHPRIAAVRAVIQADDRALYEAAAGGLALLDPVSGGDARQDSVRLGLESLAGDGYDAVLIHDAARPFVDRAVIDRVLDALADGHAGALPAVPVADTLKRGEAGVIVGTVARDGLWRAQTPQGFQFAAILEAHRASIGRALTDDAAVAEAAGLTVALVAGDERNVKITHPDDLTPPGPDGGAAWEARVGTGLDVHAFAAGTQVTLCGVTIAHTQGLAGHSDADVALHALTDALYGAIAAGDIGHHFPPSDDRWKGAPSSTFLRHAAGLIHGLGGRVAHVDVTIICEAPKVGPHRAAMAARLAALLGLSSDRVSVKATTTERLGFTGRGEGIAAQASATVLLPLA
jgi:2-C-methyl-D-erythritol 4-phosphate cytidylyltransferase/2-C-methyl-D-erythritol 2,4-cyclodiphosphate synthase